MSNVQKLKDNFIDPQGSKANVNGKKLEDLVESELCKYGVDVLSYGSWSGGLEELDPTSNGVLFKNVPYTNVYGARGRGEFLLFLKG